MYFRKCTFKGAQEGKKRQEDDSFFIKGRTQYLRQGLFLAKFCYVIQQKYTEKTLSPY